MEGKKCAESVQHYLGTCHNTARIHFSPSNLTWHSKAMQTTPFLHVPPPRHHLAAFQQFKRAARSIKTTQHHRPPPL